MFASWGRFGASTARVGPRASGLLLVASLVVLAQGGSLLSYQTPDNTESGEGARLIEEQLIERGDVRHPLFAPDAHLA